MNNILFKKEQDEFLNYILENAFFKNFKENNISSLELFISSKCNLECSYCYLQKNRRFLYPSNLENEETIINNIIILLNYFEENNYFISKISLFSGEIWHTEFGRKVLETIYDKVKDNKICDIISIPTNMCWIESKESVDFFEKYINLFKDIGVKLHISASIDGELLENKTRSEASTNKIRTKEFYNKIADFTKSNNGVMGFHPMLSADSAKYWIDNYKWWISFLDKVNFDHINGAMILEVRDNNWTDDSINDFLKFLEYRFYHEYNDVYNQEKEKFIKRVFHFYNTGDAALSLGIINGRRTCSIQKNLTIRMGDLSIVPCHRLSYEWFIYGKFIVDKNKIVGISSINPELALKIILDNPNVSSIGCDTCDFNLLCLKGCLGAQYENSYEPFKVCDSVCRLYKAKIMKLINLSFKNELFDDEIVKNIYPNYYEYYIKIKQSCSKIIGTKKYEEIYG